MGDMLSHCKSNRNFNFYSYSTGFLGENVSNNEGIETFFKLAYSLATHNSQRLLVDRKMFPSIHLYVDTERAQGKKTNNAKKKIN